MSLPSVKPISQTSIARMETRHSKPASGLIEKDASRRHSAVMTIYSLNILHLDKIPMDRRSWERWFESLLTGFGDRKWNQTYRK